MRPSDPSQGGCLRPNSEKRLWVTHPCGFQGAGWGRLLNWLAHPAFYRRNWGRREVTPFRKSPIIMSKTSLFKHYEKTFRLSVSFRALRWMMALWAWKGLAVVNRASMFP